MARPKPTQICSHSDGDLIVEVCTADAVYAVLYKDRPIKLRKLNPDKMFQGVKYSKTTFPEPGHAIALARRLNATYGGSNFTVAIMIVGRTIHAE